MTGPGEDDARRALRQLAAISESIRVITSSLEPGEVLRRVLERMKALARADALSLLLHDEARGELVFSATELLREESLAPVAGEGGAPEARTGLLTVPVRQDGRVVAFLELGRPVAEGPEAESRLAELARRLAPRIDPEALARDPGALRALFGEVEAEVPGEEVALVLPASQGGERVLRASRRLETGVIDGVRLSLDQGIAGWVARHRQAVRSDDVRADPRHYTGIERLTGFVPGAMLCVPMVVKDRLLGVIQLLNRAGGGRFAEHELELVRILAEHAAIAIENASLYREARLAALTDDLTGLGNARWFDQALPDFLARGGALSLLVLDFDHFKSVVDRHGHRVGSRVIAQIGRTLGAALRPGDAAARYGGDEFVAILPDTDPEGARACGERVREAVERCERLGDTEVDLRAVTASVGVASCPRHGHTAESLFLAADGAMYAAKAAGRNRVVVAT